MQSKALLPFSGQILLQEAARQMGVAALCAMTLCGGAPRALSQEAPVISIPRLPADAVTLQGSAARTQAQARHDLKVYVDDASLPAQSQLPIQGRYELTPHALLFVPYFPFIAGQRYRVEWLPSGVVDTSSATYFLIPAPTGAGLRTVVRIVPAARIIPANTLRFYVYFSQPMRGWFDRSCVHLRDDTGHDMRGAFMSFGQELWDADSRRLTLLIDPGLIKRGVTANLTQGPPLIVGHTYTLSVAPGKSAPFSVRFGVSPPVRTPLDPKAWHLTSPAAGTHSPLVLHFDRVMDSALLDDAILVRSQAGRRITGTASSADGGRQWLFKPDAAWGFAACCVVFSPHLEDVCGNRIGEALDHEVRPAPPLRKSVYSLNFQPRIIKSARILR